MNNLIIKDAIITNRNFEGREIKPYNSKGIRNFSLVIDNELAHILINDGWNVRFRKDTDPSDPENPGYLTVTVSYTNPKYIPKIIQIVYDSEDKPKRIPLNENTIANIDSSEIKDIKVEVRPHKYDFDTKNGNMRGIKAYLQTMYFTLVKDPFEDEYGEFSSSEDILPFELD